MKKSPALIVIIGFVMLSAAALTFAVTPLAGIAATLLSTGVVLWLCLYYCTARYDLCADAIIICTGLIFRQERRILRSRIISLSEYKLSLAGRGITLLSVIRTAGEQVVIFGEYSTFC